MAKRWTDYDALFQLALNVREQTGMIESGRGS